LRYSDNRFAMWSKKTIFNHCLKEKTKETVNPSLSRTKATKALSKYPSLLVFLVPLHFKVQSVLQHCRATLLRRTRAYIYSSSRVSYGNQNMASVPLAVRLINRIVFSLQLVSEFTIKIFCRWHSEKKRINLRNLQFLNFDNF